MIIFQKEKEQRETQADATIDWLFLIYWLPNLSFWVRYRFHFLNGLPEEPQD